MKQKVVITLCMNDKKSRTKALKTVVGHSGVESTALQGQEKNQIEVVGDGIDAAVLTSLLRKNVGYAELVSVNPVGDKKGKDDNKDSAKNKEPVAAAPAVWCQHPYGYSCAPYQIWEVREPGCTVM